jgi:cytochrome c biogenesis protein ResB
MSIFNPNSTNLGGRLINQEWDSMRQAKHMARALEEKEERAAERAAQAKIDNDPTVVAEREKRLAAEAELKAKEAEIRAVETARNKQTYVSNGGFFGMMGRLINFLLMIASGGLLAFCTMGVIVLAANGDFTAVPTVLGVAAFAGVLLALTVRKFRKPLKS